MDTTENLKTGVYRFMVEVSVDDTAFVCVEDLLTYIDWRLALKDKILLGNVLYLGKKEEGELCKA